jgi:hypothetical protein
MHKRRAMSEAWTGGGVVTDARTDVCFGGKVSRPPLVGNGSHLRRECYTRHLAEGQGPGGGAPAPGTCSSRVTEAVLRGSGLKS